MYKELEINLNIRKMFKKSLYKKHLKKEMHRQKETK